MATRQRTEAAQRLWEREQKRATKEHGGDAGDCRKHVERERRVQARCPVCGGLNPGDMSHTRCM